MVSWRMLPQRLTSSVARIESVIVIISIGEVAMRATARAGQHAMGDVGAGGARATLHQRVGGVAVRAAGVDEVVDQDAVAADDVADDVHHLGHAGALAALVDDGEVAVQPGGDQARARTTPPTSGETIIRSRPA